MNYTLGLQSTLFPSLISKSSIKVIFVQLKKTKTLRTLPAVGAQWLNVGWNLKLKLPFSLENGIGLRKGRIVFFQVWFYKSIQGHSTVAANNWKGPSRSLKSTFFPRVTLLCFPDWGSHLQPTELMIRTDVWLDVETQLECFPRVEPNSAGLRLPSSALWSSQSQSTCPAT